MQRRLELFFEDLSLWCFVEFCWVNETKCQLCLNDSLLFTFFFESFSSFCSNRMTLLVVSVYTLTRARKTVVICLRFSKFLSFDSNHRKVSHRKIVFVHVKSPRQRGIWTGALCSSIPLLRAEPLCCASSFFFFFSFFAFDDSKRINSRE